MKEIDEFFFFLQTNQWLSQIRHLPYQKTIIPHMYVVCNMYSVFINFRDVINNNFVCGKIACFGDDA